jgi:hypothetical protein
MASRAAPRIATPSLRPYVSPMRWEPGRQGTGYRKLRLASGRRWDLYVIDYPPGTAIPEHTDPVPGRRHFRTNLRLWGADAYVGGALLRLGPLVVFRPDVMPHGVRDVGSRRRVVLSFGIAI